MLGFHVAELSQLELNFPQRGKVTTQPQILLEDGSLVGFKVLAVLTYPVVHVEVESADGRFVLVK